jgi:hypothetical protein
MTSGKTAPLEEICDVEYGTRVVQKRDGGSIYPVYGGGGATFSMDEFNREDRLVVSRFGMSEECTSEIAQRYDLTGCRMGKSAAGSRSKETSVASIVWI